MNFRKVLSVLIMLSMLSCVAFTAPIVAAVADSSAEAGFESEAALFGEGKVELDIGSKASDKNVRFAEINGVQTMISENNNKYTVTLGESNMLVEITEKTSEDAESVVKTQYFYIDVASKTVEKLNGMNNAMQSYEEKSIRTVGEKGIRFKAHASTGAKKEQQQFVIDEYGYIITTASALGNKELTLNSPRYLRGVGFSREKNINIVYDATNDDFDVFTLVLKNIPMEHFDAEVVCKTYTKLTVHGKTFVVYGEQMRASAFDIAKKSFQQNYSDFDIAQLVFDYATYSADSDEDFSSVLISSSLGNTSSSGFNLCTVSGTFDSADASGQSCYVYVAGYNESGALISVQRTSFVLKSGYNEFLVSLPLSKGEKQAAAFVFTSDMKLIGTENKGTWQITEKSFYDNIASPSFSAANNYFSPDSFVTNLEAVTFMANLHAKYNGKEVAGSTKTYEYTLEMDDDEVFVDLSQRNSVNLDQININKATGGIDEENGYLYGQSVVQANGGCDPQIVINGLSLDARKYNKITIRMKLETVPDGKQNLSGQQIQLFYKTNSENSIDEKKSKRITIRSSDLSQGWFEKSVTMSSDGNWKDLITGIRLDPTNENLKFYIDYIKFEQSTSANSDSWYDMYLDYAIENGMIKAGQFMQAEYNNPVTRKALFNMIIMSFPESAFPPINSITSLPDIGKNEKHSEIYLLFYNAGITLGFDSFGNLGRSSNVTRSQLSEIANRILVPNNRLRGSVSGNWSGTDHRFDWDFNNSSEVPTYGSNAFKFTRMSDRKVTGGYLSFTAEYDSYLSRSNLAIDANKFRIIKVRIKPDFDYSKFNDSYKTAEIYYQPQGVSSYSGTYHQTCIVTDIYKDPLGWYVFQIDMSNDPNWKGTIHSVRFDPMNGPGKYLLDYVRFIKDPYSDLPTPEDLLKAGYKATRLFPDEHFERGFLVQATNQSGSKGIWNDYSSLINPDFDAENTSPYWTIGPWWQGTDELAAGRSENVIPIYDYWDNRDTSQLPYVLADKKGINIIKYDPVEKSISQTLNCSKIYNGDPHIESKYQWWPHQLLEITEARFGGANRDVFSAGSDRMFLELDVRLTKFEDKDSHNVSTTEHPYRKVCDYLIYFYLRPKQQPNHRIWFGMCVFSGAGRTAPTATRPGWSPDSAAHQYMYGIRQATVYNGIENSFNPRPGEVVVSNEWKKIRLDVTPHIDRAVEWANRDNIFGFEVTKDDMFFNGVNIGFESAGNYDCTVEIKNFNMVSYNKP